MIDSRTFSRDARLRGNDGGDGGYCVDGTGRAVGGVTAVAAAAGGGGPGDGKLRSIMQKPQRTETQSHPSSGLIHQPRRSTW